MSTDNDIFGLDRFFALSVDMLAVAGFDGYFKHLNPAWEKTLGLRPDELKAKPFIEFVHPEDREAAIAELGKRASGVDTLSFEARYLCSDGSYRWLHWNLHASSEAQVHYAVVRDITEQKVAEKELARRVEEVARVRSELQQFAYVASHDLREPLRMVASYVQLLARRYQGKLDADAEEFIAFAVDGASRMQTLINDLLAYSRVSTHGKPFEPTDCEVVLNRVLANLQIAIEETGALVTHDPLPTLTADGTQMIQLFQHLIGNALKFRKQDERPKVHVAVARSDDEWVFSVRDNGIGIEPQHFDRIFVIFQRLHGKGEYPGTGAGLAICRKIVERHGGRIWVNSEPGKGSTFCFTIPFDQRGAEL